LAEKTGREIAEKADEEIRGLKESLSAMALTNHRFEEKIDKLLKELEVVKDSVIEEPELGFKKALQHAAFFYNVPLDEGKFDIDRDFYEGQLMPIDQIPSFTQVEVMAPPTASEVEHLESDT